MAGTQTELPIGGLPPDLLPINGRCVVRTSDGFRIVMVSGVPITQYEVGDQMAEAHAVVNLVEQGFAQQVEVARALKISERTVRRYQRRFEEGGLVALGRPTGYPQGTARVSKTRERLVSRLKADGCSNREIARRIGVSEKTIRKLLRRLGWQPLGPEQMELPFTASGSADPKVSGPNESPVEDKVANAQTAADPKVSGSNDSPVEVKVANVQTTADPNVSGPNKSPVEVEAANAQTSADPNVSALSDLPSESVSLDRDPMNRALDRALACLGLLDDAAPLFANGDRVPRAGVLLAVPALLQSGIYGFAQEVYGSIGPAFYGLRTTLSALLFMALLRIKRPEGLKEHSPPDLGRLLGLDRAPEVKTLRRKLSRLAAKSGATELGRLLARRRTGTHGAAMGFLYLDGHVRVYHGQKEIPKTHVTQRNLCMPATTDYWVNDQSGDPLFVVTAQANAGLAKMLSPLCDEIRKLVGERRVTIVFDRGGWTPKLFRLLIAQGFDLLTYRKGKTRPIPKKHFSDHCATIDANKVQYRLAERGIALLGGKLRLRQVTLLSDNGHQTHVVTSRLDLPTIEVAYRMFERWRQENFFKYMRQEYALDALVDYSAEPDDENRSVPNPKWAEVDAKLRAARLQLKALSQKIGADATLQALRLAKKQKLLTTEFRKELASALIAAHSLEAQRKSIPRRIPVAQRSCAPVIKLATERKHLTDVLKLVAFQAESDLVRAVAPFYKRSIDEGRTLIQAAFFSAADIRIVSNELRVTLAQQSSPHRSRAIASLCDHLNAANVRFPGSRLRLRYAVA